MSFLSATTASLDVPGIVAGTLGGLALFLYGMHKMSDGLKALAGEGMKTLLSKLTTNRFTAAITGALVTAVLQSSSITTVLSVGFVSAGLMSLAQSVGVIMGANVGTTVTAQILAFDVTRLAWLLIALGFASWSFGKRDLMRDAGAMLMGFGMLFIGMDQMGEATSPLRSHPPFIDLMARMDNVFFAMAVGAVFTALVQSSSATIGIVIMLATQGHITLGAGIALGIGSKIGTCVTALLAGIGKPAEARRVGVVHVLFNLLGALLWLPFVDQLAVMATSISPSQPELEGTARLAVETPRQVANAITIFAVINLSVMIWFVGPIARLAEKLVPDRPVPTPDGVRPKYLDPVFHQTPSLALDQVQLELVHLGKHVGGMLERVPTALLEGDAAALDRLVRMDDDVDELHTQVLNYLAVLGREELTTSETRELEVDVEIANHLESIGDIIETNLVTQGRRRLHQGIQFPKEEQEAILMLFAAVVEALDDTMTALKNDDSEAADSVIGRKEAIRALAEEVGSRLARDLFEGKADQVTKFRIESDIAAQLRRIFYHTRRIAKVIAR